MRAVVVLCVLTAPACSLTKDAPTEVRPRGNATLAEARSFSLFPLSYPGPSVGGLRLAAVLRNPRSPAHTEFTFVYGTCRISPGEEGGCSPPLHILVWPTCYRYETRYSIPARQRVDVRGVPGRLFRRPAGEIPRLELYPARVTVVINDFSADGVGSLFRIARQLRGLNVRLPQTASLPPRPPRVAGESPRCRG